jgi:hypothetical protein
MGRIGKVIDHNIDKLVEVIVETRAKHNQKAYIYCSSGEDSVPVKEDKILLIRVDGTGRNVMIGFLVSSQGAQPGEKIYFGRDQEGNIVSKIKLLNDGSYTLDTDTETTGDATGDFNKIIKGETNITERKDRTYLNEANVNNTIKENEISLIEMDKEETTQGDHSQTIEGDKMKIIKGDYIASIDGKKTVKVKGDCDLNVDGNINIIAAKK